MKDHNLRPEDGTMKVFLNIKGTEDDIPKELQNFLELVNGNAPNDEFCRCIEREIARIKQDTQIRSAFMDMEDKLRHERERARAEGHNEGLQQGRQEGLSEGLQQGRQEGLNEGLQQGRQEGIFEALSTLVKSGTITLQTAAAQAGVSESTFKKKMEHLM